jgi:undecaprenyl-diphosphatase
VRPTRADKEIARVIARHTTRRTENTAELLTWGADEHILCAAAVAWWRTADA